MAARSSPLRRVRYRVRDLAAQRSFHEDVLGLDVLRGTEHGLLLGRAGDPQVAVDHDQDAVDRPRGCVGLFHLAYRVPDRAALAETVLHLREQAVQLQGLSDHGVSEAVYLADPEGNGIEIYRDRPRQAWPTRGEDVAMVTDPLDVDELLRHAEGPAAPPAATELGHIHLHVGDLAEAEAFFADGLGLRVRQRDYPGALFLARGDYHHHVGTNTWAGDRPPPADAVGLDAYALTGDVDAIEQRSSEQGRETRRQGEALLVEDPSGSTVRVQPA
jgi:catechol 2,3-dioxygenase